MRLSPSTAGVMIHPADYGHFREAVDRAFDLFPVSIAGKKVLIKPNVLRVAKAEEGIATHPAVVKAVVEKVEDMDPAALVAGDNPGMISCGANEESFEKTGLMAPAKGHYQNIENDALHVVFNPFFPTFRKSFPGRLGSGYHHQPAQVQDARTQPERPKPSLFCKQS